jgi:hypothetical protein
MRKRSKEEIEIRNVLSEVLILSLKSREKSALLYLIFLYCRFISIKDERGRGDPASRPYEIVNLKDLLKNSEGIGWLQSDPKEAYDELSSLGMFEIDSENRIQPERSFQGRISGICSRVSKYWSFISSLYSGGEEFSQGIQGDIKKGVLLFNEGFYFECHEFLEEVWKREKGKEKSFLKGLIHASVAFYHLEYDNLKGTVNYLKRSLKRLKGFEPAFLGVDVKTFTIQMEDYLRSLEASGPDVPESLKNSIPKIRFAE